MNINGVSTLTRSRHSSNVFNSFYSLHEVKITSLWLTFDFLQTPGGTLLHPVVFVSIDHFTLVYRSSYVHVITHRVDETLALRFGHLGRRPRPALHVRVASKLKDVLSTSRLHLRPLSLLFFNIKSNLVLLFVFNMLVNKQIQLLPLDVLKVIDGSGFGPYYILFIIQCNHIIEREHFGSIPVSLLFLFLALVKSPHLFPKLNYLLFIHIFINLIFFGRIDIRILRHSSHIESGLI
jgi:hypothetical protein